MYRTGIRSVFVALGAVCALAVTPTLATPAQPALTASEQLDGTTLRLTPQIAWESAVLRVSGPKGYALSKRFPTGTPISANLATEAAPTEIGGQEMAPRALGGFLPDGRYRYEMVLSAAEGVERHDTGLFFVHNGSLVSRRSMRGELEAARAELAREATTTVVGSGSAGYISTEWLFVNDADDDGLTHLLLDSDDNTDVTYERWVLANRNGTLHIEECENNTPLILGCERYVMSFPDDSSGRVGIGTSVPLEELHIDSSDGADLRLTGSGADWVVGILASSNQLVLRDASNNASVVRLNQGAPGSSLVVAADGRIGVRVDAPEGDFHLTNADGSGDTVFKIARSGTGSWNLGHTATGVFTFNKSGTGGQEFTVRNRNDAVATLDVQGHVRGTTFKNSSSRELKTGFEAVDSAEILQKVIELPVTSWRYKDDDVDSTHIGPVAEDFQRLFGLGDGKTISTVDLAGVALAAIQGLRSDLENRDRQIADLTARLQAKDGQIANLKDSTTELHQRLSAIEARSSSIVENPGDS